MPRKPKRNQKQLKKLISEQIQKSSEKKEITLSGNSSFSTSGVLVNLVEASQGSAATERVGNIIKMLNVQVNCYLDVAGLSADEYNYMRVILAYSTRADLVASDFPTSMTGRVDKHKSIMTLYDKIHYRSNNDKEKGPQAHIRIYRKLNGSRGYKQIYTGSGSSTASKGQLYLFALSDSSVTPHPDIYYRSFVTFTDN